MGRSVFVRSLTLWLPLGVALTGVFGFAFVAVQQNYRQSVNDPQIQMAEDIAAALSQSYTPATIVSSSVPPIDIRTSLSPWIAIYDATGTALESSGVLDGAPPQLPVGLFDTHTWTSLKTFTAPSGSETRVTWQPRDNVRQAVVLVRFTVPDGGLNAGQTEWIAVGRSMRSVEERIINLTHLGAVAWSTTVLASFASIFFLVALGWL